RAELGARHAVDAAIPWTEIAVGEHAVCELAAQLQQARPIRRRRQTRARPDPLPTRKKNRREGVELGPERVFAACRKVELRSDRRGNAKLGRAPVLRDIQVPRQRTMDRRIAPDSQPGQVAHGYPLLELSGPRPSIGLAPTATIAIHRTRYLLA